MPWVNECRKCKQEVPVGTNCVHCGTKLAKTNEHLSFWVRRIPARDWFAWNHVLRVALPVLGMVMLVTLLIEGIASGGRGIQALFLQGFFWTLIGVLGVMLFVMLVVLLLQGEEHIFFVIDKTGAHAYTYVQNPSTITLAARFLSAKTVAEMAAKAKLDIPGAVLVRRVEMQWADVKRVRFWYENRQILFFRPSWWQAMVITCPPGDFTEAEAYVRKKLGRNKQVKIIPAKAGK